MKIKMLRVYVLLIVFLVFGVSMVSCSDTKDKSGELSTLNAIDLDGNIVTADIFANYDVTMINIWATWCGPCLSEIPELANLPSMLPKNAQLISICIDGDTAADLAKTILASSNASYLTIVPNKEINENLLNRVTAVPTTVFVDNNGKIIGGSVVGAPRSEAAKVYLQKVQALLEK